MSERVDTSFNFESDTPRGKDADSHSPTLRRYHQMLWSKPLPSGEPFILGVEPHSYLVHRSSHGVFHLASDAITTRLLGKAAHLVSEVPEAARPDDLGYTIGSSTLFPGNKISNHMTINGARGFHPRIADRFDLTLECIRRHYLGKDNPLAKALLRYQDFFTLFIDFDGYVDFFFLQDLVAHDGKTIRFFHTFDDFQLRPVPATVNAYIGYLEASNNFIRARNRRIDSYISTHSNLP